MFREQTKWEETEWQKPRFDFTVIGHRSFSHSVIHSLNHLNVTSLHGTRRPIKYVFGCFSFDGTETQQRRAKLKTKYFRYTYHFRCTMCTLLSSNLWSDVNQLEGNFCFFYTSIQFSSACGSGNRIYVRVRTCNNRKKYLSILKRKN